jgi:iron complex transport system substrate-binding protein
MNAKNKTLAIVQIAVVLCSVLLVAIPAIAADQTTQKVSASEVTTASEDDYVLGIYGNANEDDTIDMGDVVYIKLAIFGKKSKTELCDAKYDGRINVLDVIQTKLIILGKEKELTVIDDMKRIVTVKKPINSIISVKPAVVEMVRSVGAKDKLIGMTYYAENRYPRFFGDLYHLPSVGHLPPDCEVILNLNPDLALMDPNKGYDSCCDALEAVSIPVYRVYGYPRPDPWLTEDDYAQTIKQFGYMFDKKEEAEGFIDWYYGFMGKIRDRVSKLSDDDKPRLYYEKGGAYTTGGKGNSNVWCFEYAGAKNLFNDFVGGRIKVDPEEVMRRDPEIMVKIDSKACNYGIDDSSEAEVLRETFMSRPELATVAAVKDGKVYILPAAFVPCYGGTPNHFFIGIAYMAKLFQPELFEDLDPEAIHQEFLTRFQRIDYDLDEWGVLVYPPFEN